MCGEVQDPPRVAASVRPAAMAASPLDDMECLSEWAMQLLTSTPLPVRLALTAPVEPLAWISDSEGREGTAAGGRVGSWGGAPPTEEGVCW
jgi:hypothetical protein